MSHLDWIVLFATQLYIIGYGAYRSRGAKKDMKSYLLANNQLSWLTIGISVMATQASAITFLSIPGQAFYDGMGFVQIYFGLPLATVVLCLTVVPIYKRLGVYTAYEYLEQRFDLKTRALGAVLFLVQRGLSTGITIYAPSLVLSTVLHWDINWTIIITGTIVTIYTVLGGTKTVSYTQMQQTAIIWIGMFTATYILISHLPDNLSVTDVAAVAQEMGKMEWVNFSLDPANRYTIWSGLLGGFFLSLSYFGTDQSQVQRYLGGETLKESRMGLIMNGIIKIPMQFFILFIGILLFVFYQFAQPKLFFNQNEVDAVYQSSYQTEYRLLEQKFEATVKAKKEKIVAYQQATDELEKAQIGKQLNTLEQESKELRKKAIAIIKANHPKADAKDSDYVFISFIMNYLPMGLIGLLVSVMISASMSSTASAFNALASTSIVDVYKRLIQPAATEEHYVKASKFFTIFWGIVCIFFAIFVSRLDNMVQAVNILGSLFYGTVLGIFLVAFYIKHIRGNAVFWAAVVSEAIILASFYFLGDKIAYLWYNLIGCVLVMLLAWLFETLFPKEN